MFTDEEKKILSDYVTSTEANVFAVKNLPGMVGAAYARYSRAKGGFREVLLKEFIQEGKVDPKHADELIARVLVAYGDDSVGELEGAHVSFEKITMLAAKEIEDHRIGGSPIEQSTRYVLYDQKDDQGNWLYYRGDEILNSGLGEQYVKTMDAIFQTYSDMVEPMKEYFVNLKKLEDAEYDINGDSIKEKWNDLKDEKEQKAFKQTYNFDLRAKACDTLRALLPIATLTNVGMFGNGRFYQTVISNLLTHRLSEMHNIAQQTTDALQSIIPQYIRRARKDEYAEKFNVEMFALAKRIFPNSNPEVPAHLPSYELMDYGEESIHKELSGKEFSSKDVTCALQNVRDAEEFTAMIYPYTNLSFKTIRERILQMNEQQRREILETYIQKRENRRHRPGRGLEHGYPYNFDCVINFGTYKDLQRHRMATQQRQLFTTKIGFQMPEELIHAGLESKALECVNLADQLYSTIAKHDPELAQYAALHGHYIRWNLGINDRSIMHLLELRSTPQGHPHYRTAAQEMHKLIAKRSKWRGAMMNFVDHNDYYWSRADSEAKQRVKEKELDDKFGHESETEI